MRLTPRLLTRVAIPLALAAKSPPHLREQLMRKNAKRPRGVDAATSLTDRFEGKGPAGLLFLVCLYLKNEI